MKLLGILLLSLTLLSACSDRLKEKECPCDVKIRTAQSDGTYRTQIVTLKTLEDLNKIRSSKIRVVMNTKYSGNTMSESTPEAQYFVNSDGVIVPKTVLTESMFAIYKAMEDLFFFDKKIGVDKIFDYPRVVSLQERTQKQTDINKNPDTALYSPLDDRIHVITYAGDKTPTALNAGVMAHEHFHAIFFKIIKPFQSTVGRNYNIDVFASAAKAEKVNAVTGYNYLVLRSLDEGLADYWGYLHTGRSDVYRESFKVQEHVDRKVEAVVNPLIYPDALKNIFNFGKFIAEIIENDTRSIEGFTYVIGKSYSNLVAKIGEDLYPENKSSTPEQNKIQKAKWILDSLKKLSQDLSEKDPKELLTQDEIAQAFIPETEQRSSICADLNLFLTHHKKVAACSGH